MLWGIEPPYPFSDFPMSPVVAKPGSSRRRLQKGIGDTDSPFRYQYGSKLHNFSKEEVPYPYSYDREVLDLWAIDHVLIQRVKNGQLTLRNFKGNYPKRTLDLGTALGDWVIACAEKWPECTFVGFDVVDVQIPLKYVEPSIANRIQWVHGNFLTSRLPFNDNEFDFVHMQGIGSCIPEPKWPEFLEEVHRVMKPGGTVEILNEDALFPILPKWFTRPLHAGDKGSATTPPASGASTPVITPSLVMPEHQPHDHALLEHLFNLVFESRFINARPSSILPVYFSAIFRHVLSPPLLQFPSPPIAPLAPLPGQEKQYPLFSDSLTSDANSPHSSFLPAPPSPVEDEFLSTAFNSESLFSLENSSTPSTSSTFTNLSSRKSCSSVRSTGLQREASASSLASETSQAKIPKRPSPATLAPLEESSILGGEEAVIELFPMPEFGQLEYKTLYMQLYRAAGVVFAVKEAMWEELEKLAEREDPLLRLFGWEDDEFENKVLNRRRFDAIFQRYRDDMHARLSLWHSLTQTGWEYPKREPLTGPEMAEEERIRHCILESRRQASTEDFETPSRIVRLLIGVKG
ncbi:S-adenosyl-L-methionine-dependent methyltransferase [Panus rudis PR-1116 ss-1]|nr:S-adenosyl-L-methionine-dependent methyltransferase [Panus rudis PR-1116 ss-1]